MTDRTQPEITPNTPLRLADAVKIAFPMGGMTVAGLRRERDRNRLIIEKIAGKEFTTLAHIERMRELCRDEAREPDPTLAATIALAFSGYRKPNCRAAYPPMLKPTRWARSILRSRMMAAMSSTANCQRYKDASSGTSLGG